MRAYRPYAEPTPWVDTAQRIIAGAAGASLIPVMASPPTISIGANGATSTVVSGQSVFTPSRTFADPAVTPRGCIIDGTGFARNVDIGVYPNVDVRRGCGWGAAIRTDSQTIDFSINSTAGATHRIQFNVNGERVGTADTGVTADSGNRYVKLTFGSSAMRTIEAFFTNSSTIRGFNIAPGATIQTAPITGDVKSVVLTDSYGVIQNTLRNRNNMYWRMMELLGIPDANVSGSGGTGWLERGPAKNLGDRGVADAGRRGPVELIVVGLGINDRNRSPADVRAQVAATTQALMLANPRALLFNIMPMWEPQGRTPRSISDAVRMGWDDVADPRRMGQADPYGLVTGTGRVGSPKGDGNADIFIGDPGNTDGLHPSDNVNLALSGHYMYGSWAAGKLLEFCHRVTGT